MIGVDTGNIYSDIYSYFYKVFKLIHCKKLLTLQEANKALVY